MLKCFSHGCPLTVVLAYILTFVWVDFKFQANEVRTCGNPLKSRAHPLLTATSLAIVAIAVLLPFTSIGTHFGFVPPPLKFYLILGVMVVVYLSAVELAKQKTVEYLNLTPNSRFILPFTNRLDSFTNDNNDSDNTRCASAREMRRGRGKWYASATTSK